MISLIAERELRIAAFSAIPLRQVRRLDVVMSPHIARESLAPSVVYDEEPLGLLEV